MSLPANFLQRLAPEEINQLPARVYDGPVRLVRSAREWNQARERLAGETVLGFDIESRPSFRKGSSYGPALIQLATSSAVYLIQLLHFSFNSEMAGLLADPAIVKTGVAIREDMNSLAKLLPFEPAGLVDLGDVAKAHDMPSRGLRTLAASIFGWRITKSMQCSNWSARFLTPQQMTYAATDAWVGRMLYLRMREHGLIEG